MLLVAPIISGHDRDSLITAIHAIRSRKTPAIHVKAAFDRWNVKADKFYLPFGIDGYKSTDNFFYSWSPTMLIAPTTSGGVLATYTVNDRLSVVGGWINGLDQIGETSRDNAFLGGFDWGVTKRLNVRYTFAVGKNRYAQSAFDGVDYDYFVNSLTATTQISKRLKYVFDWTYINFKTADPDGLASDWNEYGRSASAYGINNELIFQANKKWSFGTRFGVARGEYLHAVSYYSGFTDIATTHAPIPTICDWYTVSLGANWTPNKWLTVKPEVRYDWMDNPGSQYFNFGGWEYVSATNRHEWIGSTHQFSGGMSAIVKF